MLSKHREAIDRVFQRVAGVFERLGFSPLGVSVLAILIVAVGAGLVAGGFLLLGAGVAAVGSLLDLVDGALARRTGSVTRFGGYLDSVLDRYADGFLFLAVGWYYGEAWVWAVVFVAFLGAVLTSYARARVHEDVRLDLSGETWADLVERGERLVVLLGAIALQGAWSGLGGGVEFLPWVVVVLAVLGHATVVQRVGRARSLLQEDP